MTHDKELDELDDLEDDEPFLLTDAQIQKALDYLQSSATEAAQARADRIYLTEYRKSLKSILMKRFPDLPGYAQEREAYAHPEYIAHLEALREAIFHDEKCLFLHKAEESRISVWQTDSRNKRGNRP